MKLNAVPMCYSQCMKNILQLLIAIAICEAAGIIGSVFTVQAIPDWYNTLAKPALNPPSWVFGPVWTTLYALMGIAVFLIWKHTLKDRAVRTALLVFLIQLALNTTWSIVFFGLQNPALAFLNIVAMWVAIVWTMVLFYRISKPAMWLLVPYILWVSFAAYLNFAIWMLN